MSLKGAFLRGKKLLLPLVVIVTVRGNDPRFRVQGLMTPLAELLALLLDMLHCRLLRS